ncbi:MAG: RNA-processing protein [Candidatus Aenigmarchaeota archaeon]|nr:RNA-processing protein [Candidatus Aenigmarchaeota archaeon]
MFNVNIPEERRPILIGKDGETKKLIEKKTKTKIAIADDEISVEGENQLVTGEIIRAIGRGFSPQRALRLLDSDCILDVIQIKGTQNKIKRLMSRVIGSDGRARRNIENMTGALISVYGKTVSIIGNYKEVEHARKGVEMLLKGHKHPYVYRHLETIIG